MVPRQKISHSVRTFLRPGIIQLPSYIHDTTDFINKLRRLYKLPPSCLLVTVDDSSLYTNISHEEGIIYSLQGVLNHWEIQVPPMMDLCQLIWYVYGAIIRKLVQEKARTQVLANPGQKTSSPVEVYTCRWHLCYTSLCWTIFTSFFFRILTVDYHSTIRFTT